MSWAETTIVEVADLPLDPCDVGLPLTITHGRAGPSNQPDAPVCTFTYLGDTPPVLGDLLRVSSVYPNRSAVTWVDDRVNWTDFGCSWLGATGNSPRFVGYITRVTAVEEGGDVVAWNITGTGIMTELGHRNTLLSRPQEADTVRVAAILDQAGLAYQIRGTDTRELAADDIDRDALSALHEICGWTGGLLYQRRDGMIIYGTSFHRNDEAVAVIPCEVIGDGVAWEHNTDEIVNKLVLKFVRPSGEVQQTYNDTPSQLRWGLQEYSLTTKLWETEADEAGAVILARRAEPFWTMPGTLYTDWTRNTEPEERALLSMDVSDAVLLPISPTPGPTPVPVTPWCLEGWVETIDSTGRYTQLAVTDLSRYSARTPRNWEQMAEQTWQHWLDNGTWRDQLVKEGVQ